MTDGDGAETEVEAASLRSRVPWRRVLGIVGLLVLVAFVLPFLLYSVPQLAGAEHSYIVVSGSMHPAISPGDVILVDEIEPSAVEEGDVITFGREGVSRPTTHRVIDVIQEDGELAFQTKGDAVDDPDRAAVSAGELQGRVMSLAGVVYSFAGVGNLILFADTHVGFALFFVVPLVLFVASEVWNVVSSATPEADGDGDGDGADEDGDTGPSSGETPADPAAGAVAANGGRTEAAPSTDDEPTDAGITFRARELQLGLLVTGAFLVYSIWVSYATTEMWAFTVTGSVATALLLLVGLYLTGGEGGDEEGEHEEEDGSDPSEGDAIDASDVDDGDATDEAAEPDEASVDPEIDVDEELDRLASLARSGGRPAGRLGENGDLEAAGSKASSEPAEDADGPATGAEWTPADERGESDD